MGLGSFFKRDNKDKSEKTDSHININLDKCDGCEKCTIACPNNVLIISEGKSFVRNPQICKNCKVCMSICPNDSITVNNT